MGLANSLTTSEAACSSSIPVPACLGGASGPSTSAGSSSTVFQRGASSYEAYRQPQRNPKTLKPLIITTEASINAALAAAQDVEGLQQALRGARYMLPSTSTALLVHLARVAQGLQAINGPEGVKGDHKVVHDLWQQAVDEVDVQLHLMQPQELVSALAAMSQLQNTRAPAMELPTRIAAILLHDNGRLLAAAGDAAIGQVAAALAGLKVQGLELWRAVSQRTVPTESKQQVAKALAWAAEVHGGDEQLAAAARALQ